MKKLKIIITGSEGYIGKYLQKRLKEHNIVALDIKTGTDITGDLCEYTSFNPDFIFHLAAITSVNESFEDQEKTFITNVLGVENIIKLGGKIIFPSSATVYGNKMDAKEEDSLNPQSPYATSKQMAEFVLRHSDLDYAILRLGNVFGKKKTRVIKALKEGGKIFGNGKHKRDYVYMDDVLDAMIMAMGWENGTYNIGTGIATSVNQIADFLKVKKIYAPGVKEQKYVSLDSDKAKKAGWSPKCQLKDYLIK